MMWRRLSASMCIGAVLVSHALTARGEGAAAAETLFNEGKRLAAQNKWPEACIKFEESQRVDPGIGTLFQLANCHEHVGKTASAWAEFREVAANARASGQTAREKVARDRAAQLEGKLARLTITVDASSTVGLVVKRDGADVGAGQWGTPIAVDPGPHRVEASAPGRKSFEQTVRVDHGQQSSVRVPVLDVVPTPSVAVVRPPSTSNGVASNGLPAAPPEPVAAMPIRSDASPAEPPRESSGASAQKAVGGTLFGLGVVGLGVGTVFGVLSKSARDDAQSHCRGDLCDRTGVSLRDDALTRGTISTVAFGAGGAALVTGAVLWLTAKPTERGVTVAPVAGRHSAALTLSGGF